MYEVNLQPNPAINRQEHYHINIVQTIMYYALHHTYRDEKEYY